MDNKKEKKLIDSQTNTVDDEQLLKSELSPELNLNEEEGKPGVGYEILNISPTGGH